MADALYQVLGIQKGATQDEVKKAYRKLTKQCHPDLNPGNEKAEERFKKISAAYDILGKAESRARYDSGEIDDSGAETPQHQYQKQYGGGQRGNPFQGGGQQGFGDLNDVLSGMFGGGARRGPQVLKGADQNYHLKVSFKEAALGGKKAIRMSDGGNLNISIPKGIESGKTIRLKGKGQPGHNGGPAGDALIQVDVLAHPVFTRDALNISIIVPITVYEAALGAKIEVPTLHGAVGMTIPAGSNSGKTLRLKGRGIETPRGSKGDQMITLNVQMPETLDSEVAAFMATWQDSHSYDPREKIKASAQV